MSTAAAPVARCSSRFAAGCEIGSSTPMIGAWTASSIMLRRRRDQAGSVLRTVSDSRTEDATTQSPARRCEASPPATPKLSMPR
jgi:hypothetical protein